MRKKQTEMPANFDYDNPKEDDFVYHPRRKLTAAFYRPAYYGTSQQIGGPYVQSKRKADR